MTIEQVNALFLMLATQDYRKEENAGKPAITLGPVTVTVGGGTEVTDSVSQKVTSTCVESTYPGSNACVVTETLPNPGDVSSVGVSGTLAYGAGVTASISFDTVVNSEGVTEGYVSVAVGTCICTTGGELYIEAGRTNAVDPSQYQGWRITMGADAITPLGAGVGGSRTISWDSQYLTSKLGIRIGTLGVSISGPLYSGTKHIRR